MLKGVKREMRGTRLGGPVHFAVLNPDWSRSDPVCHRSSENDDLKAAPKVDETYVGEGVKGIPIWVKMLE